MYKRSQDCFFFLTSAHTFAHVCLSGSQDWSQSLCVILASAFYLRENCTTYTCGYIGRSCSYKLMDTPWLTGCTQPQGRSGFEIKHEVNFVLWKSLWQHRNMWRAIIIVIKYSVTAKEERVKLVLIKDLQTCLNTYNNTALTNSYLIRNYRLFFSLIKKHLRIHMHLF